MTMRKIVLFDPSIGTANLGDAIINESIMWELREVFRANHLLRFSTHTPVLHEYQLLLPNLIRDYCYDAELKFLGGTNLIKTNLFSRKPGWNINSITSRLYRGAIAIGVGVAGVKAQPNLYTRSIYKKTLSRNFVHSTRDSRTALLLTDMGFDAVNTGCPTTWRLAKLVNSIPKSKSKNVILTLTDYAQSPQDDERLLELLLDQYESVYFWVQGSGDHDYLRELGYSSEVEIVPPSLEAYRKTLADVQLDYIGTRLHAGIFAMQKMRRALILSVDNRAKDMMETFPNNIVDRRDLVGIDDFINTERSTRVRLNEEGVEQWKEQFHEAW